MMKPEITDRQHWLEIETTDGTFFIDWDYAGLAADYIQDIENISFAAVANEVCIYTEVGADDVHDVTEVWGYGARLSASGYMDQTSWTVHKTQQEAAQHLLDTLCPDDETWPEIEAIAGNPAQPEN